MPKGPILNPSDRRMAVHVEDHPLSYFDFEGVIPKGEYGGGDVIVWDWGTFEPEETDDPGKAVRKGELKFRLHGQKLTGRFTIVKTRGYESEPGQLAADPQARRGGRSGLGRRRPPAVGQDRANERRGQSGRRRHLGFERAGGRGRASIWPARATLPCPSSSNR